MKEISLFLNNKTQSMRIPKDDQFSGSKVYFEKFGDIGIVIDSKNPWAALEFAQMLAVGNFMNDGRDVLGIVEREGI